MQNITFVDSYTLNRASDLINLSTDTITIVLVDNTSNISTSLTNFSQVTGELPTDGGYVQDGINLTNTTISQYDSAALFDSDDVSWLATGSGFTARRYVMFTGDLLIGFGLIADTDIDTVVPAGNTLTLAPLPNLGWFSEQPERPAPVQDLTIPDMEFTISESITPVDFTDYFTGEAMVFEWLNDIPPGLEMSGKGLLIGTPIVQADDLTNAIRVFNSGGTIDSNNFEVNVPSEFTVSDQSFPYGLDTPDTKGAYRVVPDDGVIGSMVINGASLGSAANFEVVGDTIRTVSGTGFSSDTTLQVTATFTEGGGDDTFDAIITAEADAVSIADDAEWAAWIAAGLTYGHKARFREGVYNDAEGDVRIKLSGATPTGDPLDLVTVTTDPGAEVIFRRLMLDNGSGGGGDGFRFENIIWERKTNTGTIFAQQFGVDVLQFSNCEWRVKDGVVGDATTGVQLGYNGNNIKNVHFEECHWTNLNNGLLGFGEGFELTDVTMDNIYTDGLIHGVDASFPTPNDCKFRNVLIYDKLYGGVGSHGDFKQLNWGVHGVGPVTGLVMDNVKVFRGTGTLGFEDGQGVFAPGLSSGRITGAQFVNVFYHGTFGNGLLAVGCEDSDFIGCTILFDLTNEAGVPESTAAILNTSSGLNNRVKDCIFNTWNDTSSTGTDSENNLTVAANDAAYQTIANFPRYGSDLNPANLWDSYGNLLGSTPDLATPKMGAFEYATLPGRGNGGVSAHPRIQTATGVSFSDVVDADVSTVYETATSVINTGVYGALVEVSAGEYRVRNAADDTTIIDWTSSAGIIQDGERLQLRDTSSADGDTTTDVVVTVGVTTDTWSITTVATAYAPNHYVTNGNFGDNIWKGADLTVTDTKEAFFSGWLDIASANTHTFFNIGNGGFAITKYGTTIEITARDDVGVIIYQRNHTVPNTAIPFFHIAVSIDLGTPGHDYLYIDGVDAGGSASVFTDDTIDWTDSPTTLWARTTSFDRLISNQFGDWVIHNVSQPINTGPGLAKLIDGSGDPVDIGADGSGAIATGVPIIAITQITATEVLPVTSPSPGGTNDWNVGSGGALPVQTSRTAIGDYGITDYVP